MRYGFGPPSATYPAVQADFDAYLDQQQFMLYAPRLNGVWPANPISIIGPRGPQGVPGGTVPFLGAMQGPTAQLTVATPLSATPTVLLQPDSTTVATYTPAQQSYLLGGSVYIPTGTVVLELWDQTAGVSIYKTGSFGAGSVFPLGPLPALPAAAGGYPLTAGNTYVWRATGSGSAVCYVDPIYFDYVAQGVAGYGASAMCVSTVARGITTANQVTRMVGNPAYIKYLRMGKVSYFYQATITNTGTTGYVQAALVLMSGANISTTLANAVDVAGAYRQVQPGETFTTPAYGTAYQFGLNVNYAWVVSGTSNGGAIITTTVMQ